MTAEHDQHLAPRECRAKFCVLPAVTEYTRPDNGKPLWLCEQHGDDLALGFELKAATDDCS